MKQFLESPDFLQTVISESEKVNEATKRLVDGLSENQLGWTSTPGSWSIAQCLDHLTVSSAGFNPYFNNALERGRKKAPTAGLVPYRPSFMGGWLIKQLVPEATRKVPAPKIFRPSDAPVPGAVEKFLKQQSEFLSYVRDTKGIDYNKTRLRSPVTPIVRYSLADAFVIIVVHNWRHLGQAQRMRDTPGFPAN
jgi:hypothetical protein